MKKDNRVLSQETQHFFLVERECSFFPPLLWKWRNSSAPPFSSIPFFFPSAVVQQVSAISGSWVSAPLPRRCKSAPRSPPLPPPPGLQGDLDYSVFIAPLFF